MYISSFQAPEQLCAIIAVLIAGNVCSSAVISSTIDEFVSQGLADEYGSPDVINDAYGRLKKAASL